MVLPTSSKGQKLFTFLDQEGAVPSANDLEKRSELITLWLKAYKSDSGLFKVYWCEQHLDNLKGRFASRNADTFKHQPETKKIAYLTKSLSGRPPEEIKTIVLESEKEPVQKAKL